MVWLTEERRPPFAAGRQSVRSVSTTHSVTSVTRSRALHATAFVVFVVGFASGLGCGDTTSGTRALTKAQLGGPCTTATDCESAKCLALENVCTQECAIDPLTSQDNCPQGFRCRDGSVDSVPGTFCQPDLANALCETDANCPIGHFCADVAAAEGTEKRCVVRVNNRGLCTECDVDSQCEGEGSRCVDLTPSEPDVRRKEKVCATACTDSTNCPTGFDCTNGVCQPGEAREFTCSQRRGVCAACQSNNDCGGPLDDCLTDRVTGKGYCGLDCSLTGTCPEGFLCSDLSAVSGRAGVFQCIPQQGKCDDNLCTTTAECRLGTICTERGRCEDAEDGSLCTACDNDDQCLLGNVNNRCIVSRATEGADDSQIIPGEAFCSPKCENDFACPIGFACLPLLPDSGDLPTPAECGQPGVDCHCIPRSGSCRAGASPIGADCRVRKGLECRTGVCLDYGSAAFCSAPCNPEADDQCPAGYRCSNVDVVENGVPRPQPVPLCVPEGGVLGDVCGAGRAVCQSGLCLDLDVVQLCTDTCLSDADCGNELFRCSAAVDLQGTAVSGVCVPRGGGNVGDSCQAGPAACESLVCLLQSTGNVCTVPCSADAGGTDCIFQTALGEETWNCEQIDTDSGTGATTQQSFCVPPATRAANATSTATEETAE